MKQEYLSLLRQAYIAMDTNPEKNNLRSACLKEIHQTYHYLCQQDRGDTAICGALSQLLMEVKSLERSYGWTLNREEKELLGRIRYLLNSHAADIGNVFLSFGGI